MKRLKTAKNGFGVTKKNGRYRRRPLSSAKNNMSRLLRFHEFVSNSDGKRRRTLPIVLAKQACKYNFIDSLYGTGYSPVGQTRKSDDHLVRF